MLTIRLSRIGRKGEAKYRVVVKEKRSKRDGASVDTIGFYEKVSNNKIVTNLDTDKLKLWKSRGAQISPAVEKILNFKPSKAEKTN
jgi:small subunit ribosomal protein S16